MFDNLVAKEGRNKILIALAAFIFFVVVGCGFMTFVSFVALALFVFVYRFNSIDVHSLEKEKIYAPISGKISAIDTQDLKKIIYIDVSLCNSHILRSLDSGKVKIEFKRGVNLLLSSIKAKKMNDRTIFKYENCSMELISSMCNDTLEIPNKIEFKKGEKIGTFLHGEVTVQLDKSYNCKVEIGDKIESGVTVLAQIN